jgi:hypothetical protein
MEVSAQVRYSASGHLVYVQDNTLVAQAVDASSLAFVGDPIRIADGVRASGTGLRARFSLSATGVLVHQSLDEPSSQLRWYDQAGHPLGTLGAAARIGNFRISPDATRVVVDLDDNPRGGRSVWVVDSASGSPTAPPSANRMTGCRSGRAMASASCSARIAMVRSTCTSAR